jgi:FkbM family methyltransferase
VTAEFISLTRFYASIYASSLRKSKYCLLSSNRREFLIRNEFGKKTVELFFDLSLRFNASRIIECGANDATVSRRFIREAQGRSAIAIEANPFVYNHFKTLNSMEGINYLQMGLSNRRTLLEFNIPKVTELSTSIFGSFQKLPKYYSDYSTVRIEADRLDNIIRQNSKTDAVSVMWIDVEGEAFKVLLGASRTLSSESLKMIYIEVQEADHYRDEKRAIEIASFLESYGFTPVARDFPLAELYNLLFLKDSTLINSIPVLSDYWASLEGIKAPKIEFRKPLITLSKIKTGIFKFAPKPLHDFLHLLFAFAGSRSSKNYSRASD